MSNRLRAYTEEEIEFFLGGDRREVDKLLLHGISAIAAVLIPLAEREEKIFDALGDGPTIRTRGAWIEAQIEKQRTQNAMMRKIAEAGLIMCILGFIGFLGYSIMDFVVDTLKVKIATSQVIKP